MRRKPYGDERKPEQREGTRPISGLRGYGRILADKKSLHVQKPVRQILANVRAGSRKEAKFSAVQKLGSPDQRQLRLEGADPLRVSGLDVVDLSCDFIQPALHILHFLPHGGHVLSDGLHILPHVLVQARGPLALQILFQGLDDDRLQSKLLDQGLKGPKGLGQSHLRILGLGQRHAHVIRVGLDHAGHDFNRLQPRSGGIEFRLELGFALSDEFLQRVHLCLQRFHFLNLGTEKRGEHRSLGGLLVLGGKSEISKRKNADKNQGQNQRHCFHSVLK